MFNPLIEQYFFINYISGFKIFGIASHIYFYLILLLGFSLILFLKHANFSLFKKYNLKKIVFIFIIIIWFATGLKWLVTEVNWLKLDFKNFYAQSLDQKRNNMVNKIIKGSNMPENWHNFYLFLNKTKKFLPKGSKVLFLPDQVTLKYLAKYYFYPYFQMVSLKEADFIVAFNVFFKDKGNFKIFKKIGDKKQILERIK